MFPLVQEVKVRACHFPVISSTLRVQLVVSSREKPSVSFFALFDEGILTRTAAFRPQLLFTN